MPNYQIKVYYQTGDSFGKNDTDQLLEIVWTDLSKAKTALKRIKEHYRWYESLHGYNYKQEMVPEPEWHKGMEYEFSVKVLLDNDEAVRFSAFWCGYFERLYSAEIIAVPPEDDDMRIEF